jgi:nucleoid DNA-binding protein
MTESECVDKGHPAAEIAQRQSAATAVMAVVKTQRSLPRLEFGIVERCQQVAGKSPHPQTGEPIPSNVSTPVRFCPATALKDKIGTRSQPKAKRVRHPAL